jgi:RHS repeat-associated protein
MEYTFTGQASYMDDPIASETTEGFGLMFFNARWLDPAIGRFAQADSIVPSGVQGYDHYAYVNNNPLRYTDPDGHCPACVGLIGGAIFGIATVAIKSYMNPELNLTARDYAQAALVGATAGLLISSGVGLGAGTAIGATLLSAGAGTATSALAYTVTSGSEYSSEEMTANAFVGLTTGALTSGAGSLVPGIAGKLLQGEIAFGAGMANMAISDSYSDDWPTSQDLALGGFISASVYTLGEIFAGPIGGTITRSLFRGTLIDAYTNAAQDQADALDDNLRNSCYAVPK